MKTNYIKNISLIIAVILLSVTFRYAKAQTTSWSGDWIWTSSDGPENTWLCLRKKVNLNSTPTYAITKIAAENKYWIYVNDSLVVRDGGLDIRPDFNNTYYDEIDLAPYLKIGDNIIAALVWYKGGEDGYSQKTLGKGGFLFECSLEGTSTTSIVSDESWKIMVNSAFGSTSQTQQWSTWKWVAWPISYDAREELTDWRSLGYDDETWSNAVSKGTPPVSPWNDLVYRTIPFWKDYGLIAYNNLSDFPIVIDNNITITGDLGINIQGYPYFKIKAPAGVKIEIILNDFYTQEYITKEGEQEFEYFAWQNSSDHIVKYEFTNVTGEVEILDLKFRQSGYNTEVLGSFESDDEDLNSLWTKCKNTSYVCMRDIFYDCPNRERGQWWGDVSEQILYSFYLYDTNSTLLVRKAYRELMNTQKTDGSLYTTAPGNVFHLPDQNLAAVAILWPYYLYTGDKSLLEEIYPQIKKYIEYCASTANDDGMLILQPDVWNWIDWGDNLDIVEGSANTICNASYIVLLDAVINIADLLGEESDKVYYQGLQTKVKDNFNPYFWSNSSNAYVFYNKEGQQSSVIDDRSNAWAVLAGMVDEDKKKDVINILKNKYNASPYQEMYIEKALFELDPQEAIKRMKSRYSDMIDSWSSTLWEEFPATNSNNHAWAAGPLYNLSAYLLGIRPSGPAFSEYLFQPLVNSIKQIAADIPTPNGTIPAEYINNYSNYTLSVNSPENTVGIVSIPRYVLGDSLPIYSVETNGMTLWENGSSQETAEGIAFYEEDSLYIKFEIQSGSWELKAYPESFSNIGIAEIMAPESGIGLEDNESIKVTVYNNNNTDKLEVPISYSINNKIQVQDTIPIISARSATNFTFAQTADLSISKSYEIVVRLESDEDEDFSDDTISTIVTNEAVITDWAMLCFGSGNERINIENASDFVFDNEFSLEAWVYPIEFQSSVWEGSIISKEKDDGGYALDIGGDGQGRLVIRSGDDWIEATAPENSLELDKWQHIAGVYDGQYLYLYLNGVLVAQQSVDTYSKSDGPLYIGESTAWSDREFNGGIDEVKIWKKALSASEILEYKDYRRKGDESGLVAYYRFNEGVGSTMTSDLTGNGHDGYFEKANVNSSWMQGINLPLKTSTISTVKETESENIQIYPTVITDMVNISGINNCNASIKITDITGRAIYATSNENISEGETKQINLSGFPEGIYIISVNSLNDNYIQKVLKSNK